MYIGLNTNKLHTIFHNCELAMRYLFYGSKKAEYDIFTVNFSSKMKKKVNIQCIWGIHRINSSTV